MRHNQPFSTILAERVLNLLRIRGLTTHAAARGVGRSHTWLRRKIEPLGPAEEARPLAANDVDEILAHLEVRPEVLFGPVLGEDDRAVLFALRGRGEVPHEVLIPALARQGLVILREGKRAALSDEGAAVIS